MAKLLVFSFALLAFAVELSNLFFEFVLLFSELFHFLVGGRDSQFLGLELLKESFMILFSLLQHIFEFAVG